MPLSDRDSRSIESKVSEQYKEGIFDYVMEQKKYNESIGQNTDFKQLLNQYGLYNEDAINDFYGYIEKVQNRDSNQGVKSWLNNWGGLADDFDYDDIKYNLDEAKGAIQKPQRAALERDLEKDRTDQAQDAKDDYDEYYKQLDEVEGGYDDAINEYNDYKSQVKDSYSVQEDLLDQLSNQAEDYRSGPSVVDEAFDAQLSDELRNDIRARQADRERFGSLSVDPRRSNSQNVLASAKQRAVQKMSEQDNREQTYLNTLNSVASQQGNIASNKQSARQFSSAGIAQGALNKANFSRDKAGILKNRTINNSLVNEIFDKDYLRKNEFQDFRNFKSDEPSRRLDRIMLANKRKNAGLLQTGAGLAITAGGAFSGNPALVGGGLKIAGGGLGEYSAGGLDKATNQANFKTPGYYGQNTQYFNPKTAYNPGPTKSTNQNFGLGADGTDFVADFINDKVTSRFKKK